MRDKEYNCKVSLIIPVYNVEDYLEGCLNSIVEQTIDKSQLEVLLIDDGSTDESLNICKEYSRVYSYFKVYSKENTGVSDTRNFGIKRATGKYIMYLDSDDMLREDTIKNVTDFFDRHYSEVDVVTYPEFATINGVQQSPHFRYKFLKKSGIYDLTEIPYAIQTRLGICLKNMKDNNILFDDSMSYHEDQKYIVELLKDKLNIGFCKDAAYYWNRNDQGIMGNNSNPIQVFEVATHFYEEMYAKYEVVPQYFQVMLVHDINWKMRSNMFFPYHYEKEEFENAINRIKKLLKKVDNNVIINHPGVDPYHVYYLLRMKDEPVTCVTENDMVYLYCGNEYIYKVKKIEIIVNSIKIFNGVIKFDAFLKSPIFDFMEKPELNYIVKYNDNTTKKISVDLFESAGGYYKCKTKTNLFWGFVSEFDVAEINKISFELILDGIPFNVGFYFMTNCGISNKNPQLITKTHKIMFDGMGFDITNMSKAEYSNDIKKYANMQKGNLANVPLSTLADYYDKKIWLYYDCSGVEKDNAYYQFCNDIKKDDGVQRYYICANNIAQYSYLFDGIEDYVVKFGSMRHKMLYLAADKVITAYIEEKNIIPFEKGEFEIIKQFANNQVIYLQHGILHAHLPWKYTPGRIIADRIVVSSKFELDSFTNTYHFPEYMLIPTGMPRFEKIDRQCRQTNKILFAPSWRNYLIGPSVGNKWVLTESKFIKSNYFIQMNGFLNNEELEALLEKYDLVLDFKMHPIFVPYLDKFENKNSRVRIVVDQIVEEEYKIVITDFSSFIFNFAYLKRPIIYFVPDYEEFRAGLNQYWELDLPFEKAFGPLTTTHEAVLNEIKRICENNFGIEEKYEERMDDFFIPMNSTCENLYLELSK